MRHGSLFSGVNTVEKHCFFCGDKYKATTSWQKYCSPKCSSKNDRKKRGLVKDVGRYCKQCGNHFIPETNQQLHCNSACSIKSARQSRAKFLANNPNIYKKYYDSALKKNGSDGNLKRLQNRYPNIPNHCESCGEDRVLDIAHKPNHKRNGEYRNSKNTTPDKIWILCPTCHALLDRKGYNYEQLGLKI